MSADIAARPESDRSVSECQPLVPQKCLLAPIRRSACHDKPSDAMMFHFLDGTYELFRHYYGRRRFD
jgi:hypothetical protein